MAQRVDRPVVAEFLVEVDAEDRDVHREHAARVVGDQQRPAGWKRIQAAHLGPEIGLQNWPQHTHQALGQAWIPLADLGVVGVGVARLAHSEAPLDGFPEA